MLTDTFAKVTIKPDLNTPVFVCASATTASQNSYTEVQFPILSIPNTTTLHKNHLKITETTRA